MYTLSKRQRGRKLKIKEKVFVVGLDVLDVLKPLSASSMHYDRNLVKLETSCHYQASAEPTRVELDWRSQLASPVWTRSSERSSKSLLL